MKPNVSLLIGSAALAWCALFLLIAALATDSWTALVGALLAVQTAQASTPAPLVQPMRATSPEPPAVAAAISSAATPNLMDTGIADDVSRLRARGLIIPVSGVSVAQLTDTYSQLRADGASHEALDIMAPRGTPVLAVEAGRVAKLFLSRPGGITLYQFDPTNEYVYYYAHLDRYADGIVEGDIVSKGQVIGYVGSTGNAAPNAPHLHLAILRLGIERQWWRGTPINPFLIWRKAKP